MAAPEPHDWAGVIEMTLEDAMGTEEHSLELLMSRIDSYAKLGDATAAAAAAAEPPAQTTSRRLRWNADHALAPMSDFEWSASGEERAAARSRTEDDGHLLAAGDDPGSFLFRTKAYTYGFPEQVVRSLCRGALVGYTFRALVVELVPLLLKSVVRRRPGLLRHGLLPALWGEQQAGYAAFLAASFAIFNSVMQLTEGSAAPVGHRAAAAAVAAGPALLLAPASSRVPVALFTLARAIDIAINLARAHSLPCSGLVSRAAAASIFAVANAQIIGAWFFAPHTLDPSLTKFLNGASAFPRERVDQVAALHRKGRAGAVAGAVAGTAMAGTAMAGAASALGSQVVGARPGLWRVAYGKEATSFWGGALGHLRATLMLATKIYLPLHVLPVLVKGVLKLIKLVARHLAGKTREGKKIDVKMEMETKTERRTNSDGDGGSGSGSGSNVLSGGTVDNAVDDDDSTVTGYYPRELRAARATLWKIVIDVARSAAFLGGNPAIAGLVLCSLWEVVVKAGGRPSPAHGYIGGLVSGAAAIHFEKRSRRMELAMYMVPHALRSAWKGLAERRVVPSHVPGGDVLVYSASLSLLLFAAMSSARPGDDPEEIRRNQRLSRSIRPAFRTIIRRTLHES